jgi:hypothetical protein
MPFMQLMKIANLPLKKAYNRSGEPPNFCRKGAGKDDKPTKQIKSLLNKERSTRLESDRRSGEFWQRKGTLFTS